MKRKLDTRFPAARIKKIMQTDEDVGKIALPVPVLVSKALELFLQDLCGRTYSITLQRGVKTMSSFHLKQCVDSFNTFDFLKDVVSKVPDVGVSDAGPDDRSAKRRRTTDEDNSKEEEINGNKNQKAGESSGRRQGRGRGSGRGSRGVHDVEMNNAITDKYEDDPGTPQQDDESVPPPTSTDGIATRLPEEAIVSSSSTCNHVRNFDLNLDFDAATGDTSPTTATPTISEANHDMRNDFLEQSMPSIDKITVDPPQFALSHQILEEEEEDYDKEEG